jgi:hypothetical protein
MYLMFHEMGTWLLFLLTMYFSLSLSSHFTLKLTILIIVNFKALRREEVRLQNKPLMNVTQYCKVHINLVTILRIQFHSSFAVVCMYKM